jgi:hypothetical protein
MDKASFEPDDDTDDGVDLDDLLDALGDRDWTTVKKLLADSGHTTGDLSELIEMAMEGDDEEEET